MGDYTFASMPSVSIARSKFHRTFTHNTSFNLGQLVVLGCDEVIPGSTHKLEFGSLIRMSTPIAPIMDDIQYDIYSFFVPMRLTWSNWKRFMGENTTGAGAINPLNSDKTIPSVSIYGSTLGGIADDLGIPPFVSGTTTQSYKVSLLPLRAVKLIYNRWFRNQNVEAPVVVGNGDSGIGNEDQLYGLVTDASNPPFSVSRLDAYKLPDYFTSSLPYAQKGDPVKILPGVAPVITGDRFATVAGATPLKLNYASSGNATADTKLLGGDSSSSVGFYSGNNGSQGFYSVVPSNLYADLSQNVNNTINDLRFAFQVQKWLEKDSLYGSRYWEILHAHYAVTSPDATLQDPQLLGHSKFDINIQQVLQTTGFVDPTNTNLGTPGANSVTGRNGHLATFSAVEHGYLITIGVARQKRHTYSQGLNKMWSRSARTDFYFPEFANLGAQKVMTQELYAGHVASYGSNSIFGYQEAWAEYRFLPSYNSGVLNPARSNSLDYWTLADKYSLPPTLGPGFLKEDRSNLSRALVTGVNGPDFIGSFYFKDTCVNPMPLYSIPGFADHH